MSADFGDYLVFVDESGDHGLSSIDPDFPVFALSFILIKKSDYVNNIVPAVQALKIKYWGHDQVVLHEHEIRKEKGAFGLLRRSPTLRSSFIDDLTAVMTSADFRHVTSVIDKNKLKERYANPFSPYEIGMRFCMEKTLDFLKREGQAGKTTHIIIEGRGLKEDRELELEFRRICDNQNRWGYRAPDFTEIPFELICADKKSNSVGLQLADLIVRPIALKYLRPQQDNRAFDIIRTKPSDRKYFPEN